MNELELTGRARTHTQQYESPRFAAQEQAARAFSRMRQAAAADGITLHPFSAFRDFESQSRIWNLKYTGQRTLYAPDGRELDASELAPEELVHAILNWSALPGGSRHHWGSEIDVVDTAAVPEGYQIKLLPEETEPGGVFYKLHLWLDNHMGEFGFFRPYAEYQNGVCPEPWHISYSPISQPALEALSLELLQRTIAESNISGREIVQSILPEIYENYILNVSKP